MPDAIVNFEGEWRIMLEAILLSVIEMKHRDAKMLDLPHGAYPFLDFFFCFLREMVNSPPGHTVLCSVKYKRLTKHFWSAS